MLLTRVATAAVLLPLVIAGIVWLPTGGVALVAAALLLTGAWEWGVLLHWVRPAWRGAYVCAAAGVFVVLWWAAAQAAAIAVLMAASAWWLAAVVWIARFPRGWEHSLGRPTPAAALGLLVLGATFLALIELHAREQGALLLLLMLVVIWAADTGAYFAGRFWGRHKLAPRVSPGKTWEGAFGGVALAVLAAVLGGSWLLSDLAGPGRWLLLGAVTAVVSVVGDLSISMFKRSAGVKDAGSLFPGHGGVLDRLDSLLAAAPLFALGVLWLTD